MAAELKIELKRLPKKEKGDFSQEISADFGKALEIIKTVEPMESVHVLIQIGIALAKLQLNPEPAITQLEKIQEAVPDNAVVDKMLFIKRPALYGLGKIYLAARDVETALDVTARDPYPGGPFEPQASLEIARALYRMGQDPSIAMERANQLSGRDTRYAPFPINIANLEREKKIYDDILIARTMFEIGLNSRPMLDKIRAEVDSNPQLALLSYGEDFGEHSSSQEQLAIAYGLGGDLKTSAELIDELIKGYQQRDIDRVNSQPLMEYTEDIRKRQEAMHGKVETEEEFTERQRKIRDEEIERVKQKDYSDSRSYHLRKVALGLLSGGKTNQAVELILQGGDNLSIAEIAAKANQSDLAIEFVNKELPEKSSFFLGLDGSKAAQVEILANIGRIVEEPEPVFAQAISILQTLHPDTHSFHSYRSFAWNELAKSLTSRGYDATFAFEQAVSLLELQNGPLVARSKLGEWNTSQLSTEGEVGSWSYFKDDMVDLANSQLEAGLFELAENTIQRFKIVDMENKFFRPQDEAAFWVNKAVALANQ